MNGKKAKKLRKEIYGDFSSKRKARLYNQNIVPLKTFSLDENGEPVDTPIVDTYGRPMNGMLGTVKALGRRKEYQEAKKHV